MVKVITGQSIWSIVEGNVPSTGYHYSAAYPAIKLVVSSCFGHFLKESAASFAEKVKAACIINYVDGVPRFVWCNGM
jgi:hypothetical protein